MLTWNRIIGWHTEFLTGIFRKVWFDLKKGLLISGCIIMKCSRNLFSVASKVLSWPIDTNHMPKCGFFSKVIIKFPNFFDSVYWCVCIYYYVLEINILETLVSIPRTGKIPLIILSGICFLSKQMFFVIKHIDKFISKCSLPF